MRVRRFVGAELKARWMAAVWLLASAVALGFIWITLQKSPDGIILPPNFEKQVAHNDLLIGSSLTRASLPGGDLYANVLNPDRVTHIAGLPSISESHSIAILEAAVAAGADTVLLEVNAFAHEYNGLQHHPWAATLAGLISENGKRLTLVARTAAGLPTKEYNRVRVGRISANRLGFELGGLVKPELFPRTVWETTWLEEVLADAHRRGTRVLLFWPPLPEGGFGRDRVRYAEMSDYISTLAKHYELPLWTASAPWPDQLFMDNIGHLNANGRERFAAEISAWANSL